MAKKVRKLNYKNGIASKKGFNKLPVFVLFFFAVLLYALTLFFVVLPQNIKTTPQNEMSVSALDDSGSCGDNVTYTFDSITGVLTISGTGKMEDYSPSSSPFYNKSEIKSITIKTGVTSIGDSAFYDCSGLTSIAIPNSVTSIDDYAFEGCSGLTSIVIPDGVTSISSIALNYVYEVTIIGSGDTTKTAFTYAKYRGINYATAWVKSDSSTHTRTFYGFRADRNATAVTQTENHNFGDADICSVCGAVKEVSIKIDVTTNVSRGFVIYILDSSNQPIRQFVVTNGDEINFTIVGSSAFTIQVYEILYMRAKIDNVDAFKRKYENLTVNTTIAIDIIGVMNVNNWVMI